MRDVFDKVDRRLSRRLSEDGRQAVNDLAHRLDFSPPTVRGGPKSLIDGNLLKNVGMSNVSERPDLISAVIGISATGRSTLSVPKGVCEDGIAGGKAPHDRVGA